MAVKKFIVDRIRTNLYDDKKIVFTGWFNPLEKQQGELIAEQGNQKLQLDIEKKRGIEIRQKHIGEPYEINEEVAGTISLPEDWETHGKIQVFHVVNGEKEKIVTLSVKQIQKIIGSVEYCIDSVKVIEDHLEVIGWALGNRTVELQIQDQRGKAVPFESEQYYRKDLLSTFYELKKDQNAGFRIKVKLAAEDEKARTKEAQSLAIIMQDDRGKSRYRVNLGDDDKSPKEMMITGKRIKKAYKYLLHNGLEATVKKSVRRLRHENDFPYDEWRERYEVTAGDLQNQRKTNFEHKIFFSIVIPLYMTNKEYLKEMINSICAQTYGNWELCLADGSGKNSPLTDILEDYTKKDTRIRFCTLEENLGISGNTNAALNMAKGDVIVLADHDDIMPANALYELAKAWNEDSTIDVVYSDEDKISMDGKQYFDPHFKSDFNIDLLCSMNYICHLFAFKKEILEKTGTFRKEFDGAQDYDFILRCCENAKNIHHIPKVLYHWRCHLDSTASNPDSKRYAFEAGRKAVEEHYKRVGIPARVEHSEFYGMYRTIYEWQEKPLVSILIPNKDHIDDLEKCLNSIRKSDYTNYEIIIIENNSTEEATFSYYKQIESDKIHVVYYEGEFNFSSINNFGASYAKGEYFLLLNNDTEMIYENCIRELLGYCMRTEVGAVGARLYYSDDTIQHAGVVLGFGGIAGHTFIGKSRYDLGYFGRIVCAQDYSAVTAACMMTKRSAFEKVEGLSEELRVAFNDIDYCMKLRRAGYLIVYNPYAELYHFESKSRGLEDTPDKVERFNGEIELFNRKWEKELEKGDPYYNPNLTLDNSDFSLRK